MDTKLYEMAIIQNWKDTEIDCERSFIKIDTGKSFVNMCRLFEQIKHDENYYNELQERAMHEIASDIRQYGGINCLNGSTYPPLNSYEYYANFKTKTWEEIMEDFHNFEK